MLSSLAPCHAALYALLLLEGAKAFLDLCQSRRFPNAALNADADADSALATTVHMRRRHGYIVPR